MAAVAAVALAYLTAPGFRSEIDRALSVLGGGDADAIRDYVLSYGAWAPVVSLLLMVLQAIAAPVPGFLVAFANGLAFGVVWGGVLTLVGQTLAAALCFWIARSLGRGPVEALAGKLGLAGTDRWLTRWGVPGVLATRLLPGMAFDAVSYAAGLTGMVFGRFLLATIAGAAPQAFLYAALGRHIPGLAWLMLAATGVVTGGVLAVAFVRRRARGGTIVPVPSSIRERPADHEERHGRTLDFG